MLTLATEIVWLLAPAYETTIAIKLIKDVLKREKHAHSSQLSSAPTVKDKRMQDT